jgi:hypothetical protein
MINLRSQYGHEGRVRWSIGIKCFDITLTIR